MRCRSSLPTDCDWSVAGRCWHAGPWFRLILTLMTVVGSPVAASRAGDPRQATTEDAQRSSPSPESRKPFVPTANYAKRSIEGWTVHVNQALLAKEADRSTEALKLLQVKLYEIRRAVPLAACRKLQEVPIWLGVDDGHAPCAEYHPNREWLLKNGFNPDKAKSVEIGNAARFLEWSKDQPAMVLHELAHSYLDRVLGLDHRDVRAAYESAVKSRIYDSVLRNNGKMERAYALSNPEEYFAEATEAFFGTNDFYPFVRVELEKHDPQLYKLLVEVWIRRGGRRE
jgi:hypothetical protein